MAPDEALSKAPAHAGQPAQEKPAPELPQNEPEGHQSFLQPVALLNLLIDKARFIVFIALLMAVVLTGIVLFLPFPFKASAIVFVDPRDERVTLQEEVLPAIGADAAVLESMVQIVKSDGFLIELIKKMNLNSGSEWTGSPADLETLARLRKQIQAERMGATYLVNVGYQGKTADEAARMANEVANAFVSAQNGSRSQATEDASRRLSDRLVEIRARLNESEEAVARFKADNDIVYIDQQNTVQMRQLSDLSQQLALIQNATEEAEARYSEGATSGTFTRSSTQGGEESEQLSFLRRQLNQLEQTRDQQLQSYGPRHPRLLQTQRMIDGIKEQIASQRRLLVGQLKSERNINVSKQDQLKSQVDELSAKLAQAEEKKVQLAALEREATANREIYQQLLSRNKATFELALLPSKNVRIVSAAIPPARSTRPPLALVLPVLLALSLAGAVALTVLTNLSMLRSDRRQRA